jgi:hypothetical protein
MGGSIPGENALKACAFPYGEGHHNDVDRRRDEERHAEHEEGQPRKGKALQPARDARGRPDLADTTSGSEHPEVRCDPRCAVPVKLLDEGERGTTMKDGGTGRRFPSIASEACPVLASPDRTRFGLVKVAELSSSDP